MAHLHITSWVIAFVLVALVTTFARGGREKAAKISHMILRVFYLLILYSGGSLFASYSVYGAMIIIKVLVGLWAIAAMEMVCVKYKKKKPAAIWWGQLLVAAVIALVLGFGFLGAGILPA
ncbi:YisL family protein [Halobacillus kuroshimensis]|uniref:YisL family protein n=1 Tax=Halobacillus kuroshimensis TaxID=302481 RepID=A0ABS3DQU7_9BACI|nr:MULTISPECIES: YisL family protein [Halobacillus]MBN8233686.1 YisL family protein [Halobacillus kuroshimensis]